MEIHSEGGKTITRISAVIDPDASTNVAERRMSRGLPGTSLGAFVTYGNCKCYCQQP